MALLMPGLGRARDAARRTDCASRLRQMGMAMGHYAADYNGPITYNPFIRPDTGYGWAYYTYIVQAFNVLYVDGGVKWHNKRLPADLSDTGERSYTSNSYNGASLANLWRFFHDNR